MVASGFDSRSGHWSVTGTLPEGDIMSPINITIESIRAGLTAIVEAEGADYVYQGHGPDGTTCQYVNNGQPDCIVGRYLASEGVSVERLTEADRAHHGTGQSATDLFDALKEEGVVTGWAFAGSALRSVQRIQDAGATWGEALKELEFYEA